MHNYTINKTERLLAIEEILSSKDISTQEELLKELERMGLGCTQATLSRNLRQLRVSRVTGTDGKLIYSINRGRAHEQEEFVPGDFSNAIVGSVWARDLLLLKTLPGYAGAVASMIDRCDRLEIAGTVAGDDTIIIVPHDNVTFPVIRDAVRQLLPGSII